MKFYNRILNFTFFFILLLFTGIVAAGDHSANKSTFEKLNWAPRNYSVLKKFIAEYGKGGRHYDAKKPPYALFDWDQTSAHFDVEEAVFHYQLTNLKFRIPKDTFAILLKNEINGISKLSEAYNNISLKDINDDLILDYNFLYDNYLCKASAISSDRIKHTYQYNDFKARLAYLYNGYCDTKGIGEDYAFPWIISLFTGFTIPQVKELAKEAIDFELGNKIGKQTWVSPDDFPTKSGIVTYSFRTGLRVFPEIQNLMKNFRLNGIDVYVVSASFKPVVEVFSGIGKYGYDVPESNVIALQEEISGEGKIIPQYKKDWVITQKEGKVKAVNLAIKTKLGKNYDPIFAAGDSDGDYEMCTMFKDMKLSLIWNRLKSGNIGKLCALAVKEAKSKSPRYILQGRDENTGVAIPTSESILLGSSEKQLLHK